MRYRIILINANTPRASFFTKQFSDYSVLDYNLIKNRQEEFKEMYVNTEIDSIGTGYSNWVDDEWQLIGTAPKSGITIEVSYGDGSDESENCLAFWSKRPVCMGGATVMIPAGWATAGNETDKNLPLDEPKLWREI